MPTQYDRHGQGPMTATRHLSMVFQEREAAGEYQTGTPALDWIAALARACKVCGRVVKSPCDSADGYHEAGPWDTWCRDWF